MNGIIAFLESLFPAAVRYLGYAESFAQDFLTVVAPAEALVTAVGTATGTTGSAAAQKTNSVLTTLANDAEALEAVLAKVTTEVEQAAEAVWMSRASGTT